EVLRHECSRSRRHSSLEPAHHRCSVEEGRLAVSNKQSGKRKGRVPRTVLWLPYLGEVRLEKPIPEGSCRPGVRTRAIPGHQFGLKLSREECGQLIAFLRSL